MQLVGSHRDAPVHVEGRAAWHQEKLLIGRWSVHRQIATSVCSAPAPTPLHYTWPTIDCFLRGVNALSDQTAAHV